MRRTLRAAVQALGEIVPVAVEAVGVVGRQLRRLRLEEADAPAARVPEAVDAPDAGPEDVAGVQGEALAVGLGVDVAGDDRVALLERMVVELGRATRLLLDHEQLVQDGAEARV